MNVRCQFVCPMQILLETTKNYFMIVWPCIATNSLWIKPTDALTYSFFGITTLQFSGSRSAHHQKFLAYIGFSTFYAVVMTFATRSRTERSSILLHKMYQNQRTAMNSWWLAERLPETCRFVIPIKLEFNASVGFIHKVPKSTSSSHIWQFLLQAKSD
jgi:hypothetical protein